MADGRHDLNRRYFLRVASSSVTGVMLGGAGAFGQEQRDKPRPNFLWISTEDMSPDMGCYGDAYAVTPNLDRLASQGVRYDRVFSHAGVCAPTRSGIITGMYPTTIGTQHMRCQGVPPHYVKCFPEYLRAAGYYCTNNVKTDYQFDPPLTAWDECSGKAHWRNRPKGSPFFAVINFTTTHESQIRNRSPEMLKRLNSLGPGERHDPAKARAAAVLSGYPEGPPGLGPVLRPHHAHGQAGQGGPGPARSRRAGRRHDRLVLGRPRAGPAPGQAVDLRLGQPGPADHPRSREVAQARHAGQPRRPQAGRHERRPGRVHRFRSDDAVAGGRRDSQAPAGPGVPGPAEGAAPRLRVRRPRPDGRGLRPDPDRSRQAIPVHSQLHVARLPQPGHRLHEPDADHAGDAPAPAAERRKTASRGPRGSTSSRPSPSRSSTTRRPIRTRSTTWRAIRSTRTCWSGCARPTWSGAARRGISA